MTIASKHLSLDGDWAFAAMPGGIHRGVEPTPPALSGAEWLPAKVPGTVQAALASLGRVSDPFVDANARELLWVEDWDWCYRRTFAVPTGFIQDRVELVLEGLDTYASIYLNGHLIGHHANMFVPCVFDVTSHLRAGPNNELMLYFERPLARVAGKDSSKLIGSIGVNERRLMRKAQFGYGWDWPPRVATVGPWRPIRLESFQRACIRDIWVRTTFEGAGPAQVQVGVELEAFGDAQEVTLEVAISLDGRTVAARSLPTTLAVGLSELLTELELADPKLWWPNGLGEQPLYELSARLKHREKDLHQRTVRFGVRQIGILQEPAEGGTSFVFTVNGMKVFAKGANWSPTDLLTVRSSPEVYRDLLEGAAEAHFNMLRVNGVGIYEDPDFYDLCDKLGILIWQDFMFSCAGYPEDEEFLAEVRREARSVVRALRNHPCIALWCGNNECQWIYGERIAMGEARVPLPGERIYNELLPAVCAEQDPTRPYWPGCPYGGEDPNSQEEGDSHTYYTTISPAGIRLHDDHAKFASEFGAYFGVPESHTLERFLSPSQRSTSSEAWQFRSMPIEGDWTRFRRRFPLNVEGLFGVSEGQVGFEEFMRFGRLLEGEVLKDGFEHYRRRMFDCGGALFWCLNSVWPTIDYSVIDYYGERKAGYYYAKRACAPLLVSFKRAPNGVVVWVTNDRPKSLCPTLTLRHATFDGETLWEMSQPVDAPANASQAVTRLDFRELPPVRNALQEFIAASLTLNGTVVSENTFFFRSLWELQFPTAALQGEVMSVSDSRADVRVATDVFARNVCLRLPGARFSNNYFHLLPGEEKIVAVRAVGAKEPLEISALNTSSILRLELPLLTRRLV